jgi:hypothetical protein
LKCLGDKPKRSTAVGVGSSQHPYHNLAASSPANNFKYHLSPFSSSSFSASLAFTPTFVKTEKVSSITEKAFSIENGAVLVDDASPASQIDTAQLSQSPGPSSRSVRTNKIPSYLAQNLQCAYLALSSLLASSNNSLDANIVCICFLYFFF